MTIRPHSAIALCCFALACATAALAQDQSAPQENPPQQQNPQQPIYYAVPAQPANIQYVAIPVQQNPQGQPVYAANPQPFPQPQPTIVALPPKPRQPRACFLMGIGVNFYASVMNFDESESHHGYSYKEEESEHRFSGKGANVDWAMGVLIKDIVGIRGFFGLGKQSGHSNYWSSEIQCPKGNGRCNGIKSEDTDFNFGASTIVFPFNQSVGPMYNAYLEGAFGFSIHFFDDERADEYDRDVSGTMFLKFEMGKLYALNEWFNVGIGVAYTLDFASDHTDTSYREFTSDETKHSFWIGLRFVRKWNKTE